MMEDEQDGNIIQIHLFGKRKYTSAKREFTTQRRKYYYHTEITKYALYLYILLISTQKQTPKEETYFLQKAIVSLPAYLCFL